MIVLFLLQIGMRLRRIMKILALFESKYGICSLTGWRVVSIQICVLIYQSWVPEHAELHALLSMITPLAWLERVPTYKDQQEKIQDKDLSTYGFLRYRFYKVQMYCYIERISCLLARTKFHILSWRVKSRDDLTIFMRDFDLKLAR